jgi:hypothetical protein
MGRKKARTVEYWWPYVDDRIEQAEAHQCRTVPSGVESLDRLQGGSDRC